MWMKTVRHSRITSATGENIRAASLQINFDATNTSKLQCTGSGSRQKARGKLGFQKNRGFYLSKLTWLRNRRNTSLTQSSDLLSRCMVRNYVSDFLSIRDYLPHCLSSVKLRCILSGVWGYGRPEVRNYYVFPNMVMGAFRPQGKENFREDIYPGKIISQHNQQHTFLVHTLFRPYKWFHCQVLDNLWHHLYGACGFRHSICFAARNTTFPKLFCGA